MAWLYVLFAHCYSFGMSNVYEPLVRAIDIVGGSAKLAAAIGMSLSYLGQILTFRRPLPAKYCPLIERATQGKVRCEELRPDVEWAVLRQQPEPAEA